MIKIKNITTSGKRKRAIATAVLKEGKGVVRINRISHENLERFRRLSIEEPIRIAREILKDFNYDIEVTIRGGGKEGQIDAARIAVAKAIVKHTKSDELKRAYSEYDKALLVADVRRKEPNKPGDSKARRKRQKSYR